MTFDVKKDEIDVFYSTKNSAYPIQISIATSYADIGVGLKDAESLYSILYACNIGHEVILVSDIGKYQVNWVHVNKLHTIRLENLVTGNSFLFTKECVTRLFSCLLSAINGTTRSNPPKKPFEISEWPGSLYPISLGFTSQISFSLTLQTACDIANILAAAAAKGSYFPNFGFASPQGYGTLCKLRSGDFDFTNQDNGVGFSLNQSDSHDLLVALRKSIMVCTINASQSTSSPTPSLSSGKTSFAVVFDNYGEYPLHIMITEGTYQIYLHVKLDEVDDLVRCLLTRIPSLLLNTRNGRFEMIWRSSGNLEIVNKGSILISDLRALELAELIDSNKPRLSEETDSDPMAGAKKRTYDNLKGVFG